MSVTIRRYLPIFKNMIEDDGENQKAFEDFLQGVASDSYDPDYTHFEVKYTVLNLKS